MKDEKLKLWTTLDPEIRVTVRNEVKLLLEKTREQINSNASILSNWLYALNTSVLGAIITLVTTGRIKGSVLYTSAIFLCISLSLCILATGSEWLRFTAYSNKIQSKFNALIKAELDYDGFLSELKEHRVWLPVVISLKTASYVCLGVGIYFLIHNTF